MLIGAIAPYKANGQQITNINLQSSNIWNVTNNTQGNFQKNQITRATTYENTILKFEQIKIVYFEEDEGTERQYLDAWLFSKITFKVDQINNYQISTAGNNQTGTNAQGINRNPEVDQCYYEYYVALQDNTNEADFNDVFGMTTYNYQLIDSAQTTMEGTGTQIENTNGSRLALNEFGNSTYSNNNLQNQTGKVYVFMERTQMINYFASDLTVWNRGYDFFYSQPYTTTLDYNWYVSAQDVGNYEVVDVQGLMLTILGMPMAWITQAFNFTLWPDTEYALNVGHILSAVIIASVIIIIIKKVYA